ncbi:MAG: endolytic transglycosylase MltG [Candidatus Cryptobacteroides sp.]
MKRITKIASGLMIAVAVLAAAALFAGFRWYSDNRRPNFTGEAHIYVRPGMTVPQVVSQIPDSIVVSKASLSRVMSRLEDASMRPGHYVVGKDKPAVYVPRMLKAGWQTPVNLTLSGTMRTKGVIARKISNQMMLDSSRVAAALNDSALLSGYGFTPDDVFSMIIPDTYQVYWTDSVETVMDRLKAAYDAFWTEENKEKARLQGLSCREVSILASIVKGESNHEPEYPKIAGVYLNRLRCGMKLQADPTVAFCFGYKLNRVLLKHLEVDSPYNTYKYEGLPPGPICVPDKPSLESVLNPDRHDCLFFCASPAMDGTHRFASTLAEHNRNAREFQRELNVRQASRRAEGS